MANNPNQSNQNQKPITVSDDSSKSEEENQNLVQGIR